MNKAGALFISSLLVLPILGCQSSPNRAPEGAVIGGAVGAGIGAIIGHQSGETGEGAAVGGVLGALTGALAGSQMQKQPTQTPAVTGAVNQNQMSIQQIVNMSSQGVHEDVIVDRIRLTNSKFNLTPEDINYLKQNGVSQKVINAMQGW
jgi:uncharacterized protein YcfJ